MFSIISGKTKDALGLLLREVPDALTVIEFVEVRNVIGLIEKSCSWRCVMECGERFVKKERG